MIYYKILKKTGRFKFVTKPLFNMFKKIKHLKHIAITKQNYEKLRLRGNTPDSFDTIVGRMLNQIEKLESESRVGTREQTLTRDTNTPHLFEGEWSVNNSTIPDLSNSPNKILKQVWPIANKHLVLIDESIIRKLGIDPTKTIFVEQELRQDDNTILMHIKKFWFFNKLIIRYFELIGNIGNKDNTVYHENDLDESYKFGGGK